MLSKKSHLYACSQSSYKVHSCNDMYILVLFVITSSYSTFCIIFYLFVLFKVIIYVLVMYLVIGTIIQFEILPIIVWNVYISVTLFTAFLKHNYLL